MYCRGKSDEILIKYGGYYFDSDDDKFVTSKKTVLSKSVGDYDKMKSVERVKSLKMAAGGMPHERDMSDFPGYINKMFTVRSDLSVSLCRHSSAVHTNKVGFKCHYSILYLDIWRKLMPFKLEILNKTPEIMLVHDFISYTGKTKSI